MARHTLSKRTIQKGHKIARAIKRSGSDVDNPYAVGIAQAKASARKRARRRG